MKRHKPRVPSAIVIIVSGERMNWIKTLFLCDWKYLLRNVYGNEISCSENFLVCESIKLLLETDVAIDLNNYLI